MKTVSILGATGSIGQQTLSVIAQHPDKFKLRAITAHRNFEKLAEAALKLFPDCVAIADELQYQALKNALGEAKIEILVGDDGVCEAARRGADVTVAAMVGIAGLQPTLDAIGQGKTVALANKESLVCAGPLMMAAVKKSGATLLPVDSEHNAIFQVLEERNRDQVRRIILTASGGPFRTWKKSKIQNATREEALAHPNWKMGEKILIDSATMINKGLEVIEAHHLFGIPQDQIEILVHPQSVIHSMVEYTDGSALAQLGPADMTVPIAYCLGYPQRIVNKTQFLNFTEIKNLSFEPPDAEKFPALRLAADALRAGNRAPAILNGANEIAVSAFLQQKINFGRITEIIDAVMQSVENALLETMADVWAADAAARRRAGELV